MRPARQPLATLTAVLIATSALAQIRLARDVNTAPASSGSRSFTRLGSSTFFTATDPFNGTELWVTDGTTGGTQLFKDVRPGLGSSLPRSLVTVGSTLYFA